MWRGWGFGNGGGGGIVGGGEALKTWVRYMSRKRAENLRKINPKVPYPEATSIAQSLFNLVKERGPLTTSAAWTGAQVLSLLILAFFKLSTCTCFMRSSLSEFMLLFYIFEPRKSQEPLSVFVN